MLEYLKVPRKDCSPGDRIEGRRPRGFWRGRSIAQALPMRTHAGAVEISRDAVVGARSSVFQSRLERRSRILFLCRRWDPYGFDFSFHSDLEMDDP